MNGKIARALRKEVRVKEAKEREYQTFELSTGSKKTLQWDGNTGKVTEKISEGTAFITECVSGDRKMYKYLKRKYIDIDHEEILVPLPEKKELDNLVNQAREELAKQENE